LNSTSATQASFLSNSSRAVLRSCLLLKNCSESYTKHRSTWHNHFFFFFWTITLSIGLGHPKWS
jgi:hypothetical protein